MTEGFQGKGAKPSICGFGAIAEFISLVLETLWGVLTSKVRRRKTKRGGDGRKAKQKERSGLLLLHLKGRTKFRAAEKRKQLNIQSFPGASSGYQPK